MSNQIESSVAVVGAGIAGYTAALLLADQGLNVVVFERKKVGDNGNLPGHERSEMTFPETLSSLNAIDAAMTSLNSVTFMRLDNPNQSFILRIPVDPDLAKNPLVAIDHRRLLTILHNEVISKPSVMFRDNTHVETVVDSDDGKSAVLRVDGKGEVFKSIVDASGPGWRNLPYTNPKRQAEYEQSIVAFAYGRHCLGKMVFNGDSEHAVLHPISTNGSGRTSWVNSAGDGMIDIVYSDYAFRNRVGMVNRRQGYQLLREALIREGLVEILEEGPVISGFFGLEARKRPSGNSRVFHHGERGQYNSASVGDAIAPTVRLSKELAKIIAHGGTADDYYQETNKVFKHRLELAFTKARMHSKNLGGGFYLLDLVNSLSDEAKVDFLRNHKLPLRGLPMVLAKHPSVMTSILEIGKEYFALLFQDGLGSLKAKGFS